MQLVSRRGGFDSKTSGVATSLDVYLVEHRRDPITRSGPFEFPGRGLLPDLPPDLTRREGRRVHIHIGIAGTDQGDQGVEVCHVGGA